MVASKEEEVLWVLHFEGQQEQDGLNLHRTAALIVTQEKVVGIWRPSFLIKYLSEIGELAMDVTYYFYWRLKLKEYWLISENIHAGETKLGYVLFAYFDVFVAILFLLGDAHFLIFLSIQIPQNIYYSVGN